MNNKPILFMNNVNCLKGGVKSRPVIEDFNIEIYDKSSILILGESGSGRYMLVDVLTGKKNIDSGHLNFENGFLDNSGYPKIQYVPQDVSNSVNPDFTVLQAVSEGLILKNEIDNNRAIKRSRHLLNNFDFDEIQQKKKYKELNIYNKILTVIARALLLRPKILIIDDIFEYLFFSEKDNLIKILAAIQNKYWVSYIFLSNDMYVARYLCDKVVFMCSGRIMESGLIDKIFISPRHPYTEAMLWADCIKQGSKPLVCEGEVEGYEEYVNGCPFAKRCRYVIPQCLKPLPSLEEVEKGHFVRCIRQGELKLKPIID